ncbi:MAG: response regulator [Gemmataceae bacterium]|nr:response regulator [Gemmataceae bacterium]
MTVIPQQTEYSFPPASPDLSPRGLSILLVEDHADTATNLAVLLRAEGHRVRIAADGQQGLVEAQADWPDTVLLDLGLPELDGYELAQRLQGARDGRRPLLIAVTGYGQDDDRRRSREAGIDLHLVKPVEFDTLRLLLERFRRVVQ